MTISYITPQRVVAGHTSRFVRRAAALRASAAAAVEPPICARFETQIVLAGERRFVTAEFIGGYAWNALSARFTLYSADSPAAGFDSISALLASDASGRLYTASAVVDATSEAAYPLAAGMYRGEFLVTTAAGQVIGAVGEVRILSGSVSGASIPIEYEAGGGVG